MEAQRKKKETKKKEKGRPVETAAAVEIGKSGLRRLDLDDFHRCLEKPSHQTLGFPTVITGPSAINNQTRSFSVSVSHGRGAVHPILNSHPMGIEN
jgi:hypothetical protein